MPESKPFEYYARCLEGLAFQFEHVSKDDWPVFDDDDINDLKSAASLLRELTEKAWMYDDLTK
jgi:hypothetical protein